MHDPGQSMSSMKPAEQDESKTKAKNNTKSK
jgi:hypothetical protein